MILGSTGSIGVQALDVVARSDDLQVVGLAAAGRWERLLAQAEEFGVERVSLHDEAAAEQARRGVDAERCWRGAEGLVRLIAESGADLVLNGLVGSAGLAPTVAALGEGIDVALANKESLVVGGELVMQLAEATGARVIPVDSEHSALFQLLRKEPPGTVERLVVTASGGPFRGLTPDELPDVEVRDALAHPTWDMGGKITIDSATLMNKGLEVIEAHHLFGIPYERIGVVVHPESIVHALVHLNDGASLAHLGHPDMRVPISYALHYPERADVPVEPLDLAAVGTPDLRAARPRDVPLPCARARGGGRRRHGAVRPERGQRGRGARLPRRPAALPRHRARDRGHARGMRAGARAQLRRPLRRGCGGAARRRRRSSSGWR